MVVLVVLEVVAFVFRLKVDSTAVFMDDSAHLVANDAVQSLEEVDSPAQGTDPPPRTIPLFTTRL